MNHRKREKNSAVSWRSGAALTLAGVGSLLLAGPAAARPAATSPADYVGEAAPRRGPIEVTTFGHGGAAFQVVRGELLVRLKPGVDRGAFEAALSQRGGRVLEVGRSSGVYRIRVPEGAELGRFMAEARRMPFVRDVAPNAVTTGAGLALGHSNQGNSSSSSEMKASSGSSSSSSSSSGSSSSSTSSSGSSSSGASSLSGLVSSTTDAVTATATAATDAVEDVVDTAGNGLLGCYPSATVPDLLPLQWNLGRLRQETACLTYPSRLPNVVVAVLDSGVAYSTEKDDVYFYSRSMDLMDSSIVAPWDFINDDAKALDDNGHGTHMAGVVGSRGDALGVAPAVSIMPVKVLDVMNRGTELALIEGLYHAVDNGAQVINMSLSLGLGYYPSAALQDAITHAADAGVLMVSSSGNLGASGIGYPAAFPDVIAVGASRMGQDLDQLAQGHLLLLDRVAEYSNWGYALDLVAPGGRVDTDFNWDGYPDGIIAESFPHGLPSEISHWFFSGTSPATAHVSGAAAWLLALGVPAEDVTGLLLDSAGPIDGHYGFSPHGGAGNLSLYGALLGAGLDDLDGDHEDPEDMHVNLMTWLESAGDGSVRAAVRAQVISELGEVAPGVQVAGSFYGSVTAFNKSAVTNADGVATLYSPSFPADPAGVAVGFQADAVIATYGGEARRVAPTGFYSMSPATAEMLHLVLQDPELSSGMLAFEIRAEDDEVSRMVGGGARLDTLMIKPVGPGLRSGAMVMAVEPAFLVSHADDAQQRLISLSWPGDLASGWGPVSQVEGQQWTLAAPHLDIPERVTVLPLDPALVGLNLHRDYPVLNAVDSRFVAANQELGNRVPAEPVIWGFANSAWGDAFASSSLGDAFAASAIGDAFAASAIGDAFAASAIGDAFAASAIGDAFAASAIGDAFAASSIGDAFAASAIGDAFAASSIGDAFAASSIGDSAGGLAVTGQSCGKGSGGGECNSGSGSVDMGRSSFGPLILLETDLPDGR